MRAGKLGLVDDVELGDERVRRARTAAHESDLVPVVVPLVGVLYDKGRRIEDILGAPLDRAEIHDDAVLGGRLFPLVGNLDAEAIALRCDKTLSAFMGFVQLACAMIWLR